MNILIIHEVDLLKKVVFEIHSWAELLAKLGHNVFLLDFANNLSSQSSINLKTIKTRVFKNINRTGNGAPVTLIRPGSLSVPFLDRFTALFTHYFEIDRIMKEEHIDVLILYSVPTNGLQSIKIAKKYKVPIIFRSIDILHMLVPNRYLRNLTFLIESLVYRNVDRLLTLSPKLSEYVIRLGAEKEKVEFIPFSVDTAKFHPITKSSRLQKKIGVSSNDKIILYIGTLFDFSGIDLIFEQFPNVLQKFPNSKILIVGGGVLLTKLNKIASKLNIKNNVIFTGFQPFEMMPDYINLADVCINPFQINKTTRDIIPGKIIQYLACGKPIISTPLPGMLSLFSGKNEGIIFSAVEDFYKEIIDLFEHPQHSQEIGYSGFQYVIKNHDEFGIAKKLDSILKQNSKTIKKEKICELNE